MKFDAIIMNPPYGRLAPRILKGLVEAEIADEIVTIQPIIQLTSYISSEMASGIIIFKSGNKIWKNNAQFNFPLAILYLDTKNPGEFTIYKEDFCYFKKSYKSKFEDITIIEPHHMKDSIINKVSQMLKNETFYSLYENDLSYRIPSPTIISGFASINKHNFLLIANTATVKDVNGKILNKPISNSSNGGGINLKNNIPYKNTYFGFNTIIEAENAIYYLRHPINKLICSSLMFDKNISATLYKNIPLFDFSTLVTNERIQKEFLLTDQEMNFINDFEKQLNGTSIDWSKYEI